MSFKNLFYYFDQSLIKKTLSESGIVDPTSRHEVGIEHLGMGCEYSLYDDNQGKIPLLFPNLFILLIDKPKDRLKSGSIVWYYKVLFNV